MSNDNLSNKNDDFEIGDVEGFSHKDNAFSHSVLVMSAMRKVLENGSKEMRPGWFNEKSDPKGNVTRTYVEDTRKAFVEAVKTCEMAMACDLDETAEKKLKEYKKELTDFKLKLTELNNDSWESLPDYKKLEYTQHGSRHIKGFLTNPLLKEEFIKFEIDQYREIFSELTRLTKRLDFYQAETFEG